jgi:hypothetical protein
MSALLLSLAATSPESAFGQVTAPTIPIEWFGFWPPNLQTAYQSAPLFYTTNLISVPVAIFGGVENGLILDTTNLAPACLEYAVIDSNLVHNFSYDPGSVLLYFSPNWASVSLGGTGPGETAFFIGSGDWSPESPNGLFTIYTDPYGSNIYVGGVGAGVTNIYASVPIAWPSNTFHQIGVEWSSTGGRRNPGIRVYLDGALAGTGLKLSIVPAMGCDSNGFCTNGLFVGSDNIGGEQMRGTMYDLVAFSDMYGGWYTDGWPYMSNALAAWQASLGGGGFGAMLGTGIGMSLGAAPGYVDGATYTTNYADYTNFWLSIGTPGSASQLSIQNTQSNLTYQILTNSVLDPNLSNWNVWQTLVASNSVIVPPPLNPGSNALFLDSALVWSTTTNGLPDWWQMLYFSELGLDPTASYDGQGNSLLYDYQYGLCPNIINFTIQLTNRYVNSATANLQLNITSGLPNYYAAFVTAATSTNWLPMASTNFTVNLGSTDGVYTVNVGLSGPQSVVQQTWQSATLIKDTVPPQLFLTNMSNFSGSRPFIDPAGYSTKALSSLTFVVTNSVGAVSQGQGSVVDQDCVPSDMCHTTNWFVCLDAALTPGTNYIGIQAVDWAGNVTTTNFSYVFDTNLAASAPAISLIWPQSGMQLSGATFTLRGTLDDDTATVSGQYTDSNGVAQTVNGLVERGGQFWLENVPLNAGTNVVSVSATNAAGLGSTTSLTLFQSGVTLAMDAIDASLLNQVYVNVTGTISDPTYAVWVNGVQATNYGDGTWGANNVPVTSGGTGSFDIAAYPPDSAPTGSSWTNFGIVQPFYGNSPAMEAVQASTSWDKPAVVYLQQFHYHFQHTPTNSSPGSPETSTEDIEWTLGGGGYQDWTENGTNVIGFLSWPPDAGYVPVLPGQWTYPWEFTTGPFNVRLESASFGPVPDLLYNGEFCSEQAGVVEKLGTGGKALRQSQSVFVVNQPLYIETTLSNFFQSQGLVGPAIPSTEIALAGYGNEDTNGNVIVVLPKGGNFVITPTSAFAWSGGPLGSVQEYPPQVLFNGANVTYSNTAVIVGQKINLQFLLGGVNPPTLSNFNWSVQGPIETHFAAGPNFGGPIDLTATSGSNLTNISFFWVNSGSYSVSVTALVGGTNVTATTTFAVVRPSGTIEAWPGLVAADDNYSESGYYLHLGTARQLIGYAGMYFNWSITMPPGTNYNGGNTSSNYEWVQLVNSASLVYQTNNATGGNYQGVSAFTNGLLDTTYPYSDLVPQYHATIDSPGTPLYVNATNAPFKTVSDSSAFTMWLMFQPQGGEWVPLVSLDWSWSGTATLTNVPTGGNYWNLTVSNGPSHSFGSSTLAYPRWTNNITNYAQLPQ